MRFSFGQHKYVYKKNILQIHCEFCMYILLYGFAYVCCFISTRFLLKMRLLHTILTTFCVCISMYVCCAPTGLFATQNFLFHFLYAALALFFCLFSVPFLYFVTLLQRSLFYNLHINEYVHSPFAFYCINYSYITPISRVYARNRRSLRRQ